MFVKRFLFVTSFVVLASTHLAAQRQGGNESEKASEDVTKTMTLTPRAKRREQSKSKIYLPDCTQPKDHNQADLCEQMRMAEAAERAERIANKQYVVSVWGLAALIATLALSVMATLAATRAAKAAEQALTDLERPHVFVEVTSAGLQLNLSNGSYSLAAGRFEHRCVNHGRTPAALIEYLPKILVLNAGAFPTPIDPMTQRGRELPTGCVATQGTPYDEGDAAMKTFDWKLLAPHAAQNYSVYFVGYIRYCDMIFGTRYVNGFCFVYDEIGGRFVRRGDNLQYNYTRQESPTPSRLRDRLVNAWRALRG